MNEIELVDDVERRSKEPDAAKLTVLIDYGVTEREAALASGELERRGVLATVISGDAWERERATLGEVLSWVEQAVFEGEEI